jgi:hypothetical protein
MGENYVYGCTRSTPACWVIRGIIDWTGKHAHCTLVLCRLQYGRAGSCLSKRSNSDTVVWLKERDETVAISKSDWNVRFR